MPYGPSMKFIDVYVTCPNRQTAARIARICIDELQVEWNLRAQLRRDTDFVENPRHRFGRNIIESCDRSRPNCGTV